MTIPSFTGLQTALRGLTAAQARSTRPVHNIANANTPGYSRQQVDLTAEPLDDADRGCRSARATAIQLGTGVDVSQISRVRDQFLDIQYRAQNTQHEQRLEPRATILNQVQTALDEPSGSGLSTQLAAVLELVERPRQLDHRHLDAGARQTVVDEGTTWPRRFNALDQQLATIQSQAAQQYQSLTASPSGTGADRRQPDRPAQRRRSARCIAAGQNANDLLDQRDQLLDTCPRWPRSRSPTPATGMVQVNFGDAASPLVSGTTVNWPQTLTSAAGGQLGALLGLSDPTSGQIQSYRNQLDTIANQLISSVNSLQPSSPFFSGNSASTIAVAATASSIQTSSTSDPAGNDLAIADRPARRRHRRPVLRDVRVQGRKRRRSGPEHPDDGGPRCCTRSTTSARACPASRWTRR